MFLSKQDLSYAVRLARPLLILCVCIAHVPGILGYESEYDQYYDLSTLFAVFVKDFLARGAVPILTVISGYYAFSTYHKYQYRAFIKLKARRLLWPFFLWNGMTLVFLYLLWQITGQNLGNIEQIQSMEEVVKAITGVYRLPINPPTYFLRDLFLMMLAVPVFQFICQKPLRLLLALSVYLYIFWPIPGMMFYAFGHPIPLTYRTDSVVFFAFGYGLACQRYEIPRIRLYSAAVFTAFLLILGGFISMALSAYNPAPERYVQARALIGCLFVLAAPALLSILIRLKGHSLGHWLSRFSPYTFTLFLSHILTAQLFMMLVRQKLGWGVSESDSILEQSAYFAFYLMFVSLGAVLIRQTALLVWSRIERMWRFRQGVATL